MQTAGGFESLWSDGKTMNADATNRRFRLKSLHALIFCGAVKRVKVALTVLLLPLWVALTSHSLLEQLEWIHHEDRHAGTAEHHDAADGICRIESNDCPVPIVHLQTVSLVDLFQLPFVCFPSADYLPFAAGLAPPGAGPPDLIHIWQFAFRAALLPRAPSVIS